MNKLIILVSIVVMMFSACQEKQSSKTISETYTDTIGLHQHYKSYFPIGVSVSPSALETDEAGLIKKHFNSLTAENVMKMGPIHPQADSFNWAPADQIAQFARDHNLKMRGHTLCWHNQVAQWMFTDASGRDVSKEVLLKRLKEHITAVVTRYKDVVYAWDVVNEAISDETDQFYRNSKWLEICGPEYIAKAYQYAHEADTNALLFYNDYHTTDAVKRQKIARLVTELKDEGIPIHGLGMQGHWSIFEPDRRTLVRTLDTFRNLDVEIQITELDLSVYEKHHHRLETDEAFDARYTEARATQQAQQYEMLFKVFREYGDVITGVTFWNISDRHSWLDNFPVKGRKDYPLLFDENLQPKAAYFRVISFPEN